VTITLMVLMFFGLPWWIPLISLSVQILINRYCTKKHSRIFTLTSRLSTILKAYSKILAEIESSEFAGRELCDMKKKLVYERKSASLHIRRLSLIMSLFELRRNELLHPVFNSVLLWDLHCVYRIEKWKHKLSSQIEKWLGVIGRFEALTSLACLHFNYPDWSFPKIQAGSFLLEAKELGHFLIHPEERVDNDIFLKDEGNIMIITGPNMAGKSTFLKTVGVNLVLAFCGGPVCAREFVVTPVKIYTSMKVSDSLDKNLSLFYAELQRLKMVLDGIKRKEKVFFLLDEMLKGTNALDRQMGALALLKQLVRLKANGLVATHDLELTKLEKEYPDKVKNFHFDGYVEGDKLLFDYKIKEGRCESFNALLLMKKIGIDIP
jgi:DNA mismatch repair ATPase MutS